METMTGSAAPDPRPIEFWFDFSSGYAFFAAHEIEDLGRRVGRNVQWRPFMLGAAFKVTGARGLSSTPLKAEYALRDWNRIARSKRVDFALPPGHPAVALAATRAYYWIEAQSSETASAFALRVFEAYFQAGVDTGDIAHVARLTAEFGFDPGAATEAMSDPAVKSVARAHCDDALDRGVFGSPFFFVDDEPFWGWDRMAMMERWIRTGGW